jgi:hypothetical protein
MSILLWAVRPCSLAEIQYFRGTHGLYLQSVSAPSLPEDKGNKFLENMGKFLQTTRCHIPKESIFHN